MDPGSLGLALTAGILSTLSPCVLPLLPIVLGAALAESRFGPLALAGGLAVSFVAVGMFVATIGFAAGIDAGVFRTASAILMIGLGAVLLLPRVQYRLAAAGGGVGDWAERRFGGLPTGGISGQFGVGLLLGMVWSPCVGPTLGAASLLAAQGRDLWAVGVTMAAFGLGAGLPLLILGMISREGLLALRGRLAAVGQAGKAALGVLLVAFGLLILTGADKRLEAKLVDLSPAWLTDLTTRY